MVTKSFRVRVRSAAIRSRLFLRPMITNINTTQNIRSRTCTIFMPLCIISCSDHLISRLLFSPSQVPITRAEAESHNGSPSVFGDDENGWFKYELAQREETCEGLVKPDIVFFGGMHCNINAAIALV